MKTADTVIVTATERNRRRGTAALKASTVLQNIQKLKKESNSAQKSLDRAVLQARAQGYSWVDIAAGLGVSPQGARQRYTKNIV